MRVYAYWCDQSGNLHPDNYFGNFSASPSPNSNIWGAQRTNPKTCNWHCTVLLSFSAILQLVVVNYLDFEEKVRSYLIDLESELLEYSTPAED